MQELRLRAYGKINLGLDVLRKREDGYHEVRMIMQTVSLYDQITVSLKQEPGITVSTNLSYLPVNENNLVYRAAKLLMDEFDIHQGVHIDLKKHIPVSAGMAGGSSDAAAVLFGINKIFGLKLKRRELMDRGVKLGADVPYCLMRGTALSEGIGEKLTRLTPAPQCHVIIAKPPISVPTRWVYENLHADSLSWHPDIDRMLLAIGEGSYQGMVKCMGNVLETVTIKQYPVIRSIKELLLEAGADGALMSGSGPTVFGLFEDKDKARKAKESLKRAGLAKQLYLTNFYQVRK